MQKPLVPDNAELDGLIEAIYLSERVVVTLCSIVGAMIEMMVECHLAESCRCGMGTPEVWHLQLEIA